MDSIQEFQKKIGYEFRNAGLLRQAFTHSSYANEHGMERLYNNERLEFLGDAVLEIVSSEYLYRTHPEWPEGELTKVRAGMVCEQTLAFCAGRLRLGDYLLLGKGEEHTGGRERKSVLSDAFEAVMGAVYLDGGFAPAEKFIRRFVFDHTEGMQLFFDSKTLLQEIVQGNGLGELTYGLVEEKGPDHNKSYVIEVCIAEKPMGRGEGHTKKAAEQEAAYQTILRLGGTHVSEIH